MVCTGDCGAACLWTAVVVSMNLLETIEDPASGILCFSGLQENYVFDQFTHSFVSGNNAAVLWSGLTSETTKPQACTGLDVALTRFVSNTEWSLSSAEIYFLWVLTNFMAYGTRRCNAAFTKTLKLSLSWAESTLPRMIHISSRSILILSSLKVSFL